MRRIVYRRIHDSGAGPADSAETEHMVVRSLCAAAHQPGTDIPVLELEACGEATLARIESAARQALQQDRSGAIVLGCAGMATLCSTLTQRLGVPVIDGVAAAVKFAEALVALGLRTSKAGDYAAPLPKAYLGWARPLAWSSGGSLGK